MAMGQASNAVPAMPPTTPATVVMLGAIRKDELRVLRHANRPSDINPRREDYPSKVDMPRSRAASNHTSQ